MLVRIRAILRRNRCWCVFARFCGGKPGRECWLSFEPRERIWSDLDDFAEAGSQGFAQRMGIGMN